MQTLLEKLKQKQGNLSDYKFAEIISTSQQLWQMTRTGKKEINLTVIKGIAKPYSDLALDVLIFLGFDVNKITPLLVDRTSSPQTHQNLRGILRRLKEIFRSK